MMLRQHVAFEWGRRVGASIRHQCRRAVSLARTYSLGTPQTLALIAGIADRYS